VTPTNSQPTTTVSPGYIEPTVITPTNRYAVPSGNTYTPVITD